MSPQAQETIRLTIARGLAADSEQAMPVTVSRASSHPVVYLMRGLPACGKSHTARRLASPLGVVLETDDFFVTQVGPPNEYSWDASRLKEAREWNLSRFRRAVDQRQTPIVVDRGNGLNRETKDYVDYAVAGGYRVELREPDSLWWREIRVLLKYRPQTNELLDLWASELAHLSSRIHGVDYETIRRAMHHWADELQIEEILGYRSFETLTAK